MTLRKKMAHGALWSLVEKAGNQGLSFLVFMFVARLIGPKEYGLANICFVYFTFANILINGLVDGIISLQISDRRKLSTMFWCVTGLGLFLMLACIAASWPIAEMMGEPHLAPLLRWFSVTFVLLAVSIVPNKIIMQELDFKVFAMRTLIASVISGFIGLGMAYEGMGAYAIIGQQIFLYFVMNIVVWINIEWRPHFAFDRTILKESLLPGFKQISADLIGFAQDQLPRLFIGGIMGPIALGYFAFVTRLRYALQDILIHPAISVLAPAIAKIQNDRSEQRYILGQFIELMGFLMFPALALGAATAPLYVPLFFGEAWTPAVPVLQIFISGTAAVPLLITIREALRANNRMGSFVKAQIPLVVLELVLIIVLLPHGLVAMSWGVVGCGFLSVPVYVHFFKKWVGVNMWPTMARLLRPLAAVAIMLLAMEFSAASNFYPTNPWLALLTSLTIGGAVYLAACFVVQFQEMKNMIGFVKKLRGRGIEPNLEQIAREPEARP